MLTRFFMSLQSEVPFKLAWLRYGHIENGHTKSELLDKLTSEKHPSTDNNYIFTINIMRCKECGLLWEDAGLERRRRYEFNSTGC